MKSAEINVNEWMDALKTAQGRQSDEGLAAVELAEAWDVSLKTALDRVRSLHRLGLVKVGRREGVSMTGRRTLVPVYTITRPKKAAKK